MVKFLKDSMETNLIFECRIDLILMAFNFQGNANIHIRITSKLDEDLDIILQKVASSECHQIGTQNLDIQTNIFNS